MSTTLDKSSSSSSTNSNLGEELYSDTASFGRFWALLGAIMGTLTFIALTIVGIYILTKKDDRIPINVSIKSINGSTNTCPKTSDNPITYACTITLNPYTYNNINYPSKDVSYSGSALYYVGQNITAYLDKNDPSIISLDKNPPKWLGWVLIGIGLVAVISGWFWYWASRKWKFLAAAQGVGGAIDIVSGGTRF